MRSFNLLGKLLNKAQKQSEPLTRSDVASKLGLATTKSYGPMARVTWSQSVWWKKKSCPSCQLNSRDSTFLGIKDDLEVKIQLAKTVLAQSHISHCSPFTALNIEAVDELHEQLWWPECASLDAQRTSCNNQSTTRKSRLHSEASYSCSDMKTSHTFPRPLSPASTGFGKCMSPSKKFQKNNWHLGTGCNYNRSWRSMCFHQAVVSTFRSTSG